MDSVIKDRASSREDLICLMYKLRRGYTNPERPNSVRWSLTFVGPQYGTCFMLPCRRLYFLGCSLIFWKIVEPCTKTSWNIVEQPISRNVLLRFGTHWVWIIFDLRDTKQENQMVWRTYLITLLVYALCTPNTTGSILDHITGRRRQCRLPVDFFRSFRHMLKHFLKAKYLRFQPNSLHVVVHDH
jgi:hypothetical protein